jgi:hypothetical protein
MQSIDKSGSLTPEQLNELQSIVTELTGEAVKVKKDYEDNPSEITESVVRIHQHSPFLDENLSDKGWKHVLRSDIPEPKLKIKTAEEALGELVDKKSVGKKKNNS